MGKSLDRPASPLKEPLLVQPVVAKKGRDLKRVNSAIEQYVSTHPIPAREQIYPTNIFVDYESATSERSVTPRLVRSSLSLILESLPAQKLVGLVTVPLFAGYAALFSLQHVIKVFFGIPDDDSLASHSFSYAITSLYFWNLVFRLGHNFFLCRLDPKARSLVGIAAMMISMTILGLFVFWLEQRSLALVALAYAFGGMAVGTFETNFSVVLAGLGNRTKIYGISGIPLGIFLVIVPGFIGVAMGLPVIYIYTSIVGLLVMAMAIMIWGISYPDLEGLMSCTDSPAELEEQVEPVVEEEVIEGRGGSHWVRSVVSVGLVFTINMLFVSAFSPGVLLYLYNGHEVSLWGSDLTVPTGFFFAFFSSFGFVADVLSRKRIYSKKTNSHPIRYLLLTFIGVGLILVQVPVIAPFGTFLVFFANGSIYAQSCRWLDSQIHKDVSILANSLFFFLGDCGSVLGAILIPFLRDILATRIYIH
jgi:MFS family permease